MRFACRRRPVSLVAFAVLALAAELVGRSATLRIDQALSVEPLATTTTRYYPFLLAGVKVAVALAAAALAWRLLRAHAMASAADHLLATIGHRGRGYVPRLRLRLSFRLWLVSFAVTSLAFLVQN